MGTSDCQRMEGQAEEKAKGGQNSEAMDIFLRTAECYMRWESFAKAARSYERAYEHAMLAQEYSKAASVMMEAGEAWLRQGEYEKFEIDNQIASEAYILAAEHERNPARFVDGAFCAIIGGDLEMARQLIHAATETTRGQFKEQVNFALMLSEYQFGDADRYLEAAITRVLNREGVQVIRRVFLLTFAGFVRATLESEAAVTISSLALGVGLNAEKVKRLVRRGIDRGLIPAYLDEDSEELVVDSDRFDLSSLALRRRPILSSDLEDPGAWDIEHESDE